MKTKHWQEIKDKHPKALNHCIEYFQDRFLENWRVKIKKHEHLFEYFRWIHKLRIEVNNNSFSIELEGLHLSSDGFECKEEGEMNAIIKAFEIVARKRLV